jgi:DNA-binding transcriptional MerR regulator
MVHKCVYRCCTFHSFVCQGVVFVRGRRYCRSITTEATLGGGGGALTIDELARRAGTTSRNIRAYQERGLLPSPRLVGRVGYYGEGHLARLRHIADLLERGFTLTSIRELFDAWERGYGLSDVLGFEEALAAPWDHEPSAVLTIDELAATFGTDTRALALAVRAGVLVPEGDGFRVPSPRLLAASRELIDAGYPLRSLLREAEALSRDLDGVAERWVGLFKEHVWEDHVRRGMPPEELQRMTEFLQRMRPLLGTIVAPLLAQAIERRVNLLTAETFGATPPPKGSRSQAS